MSNYTGAIIGSLIGSVIAMMVLSLLLEWAIFKRVMDDPVVGKVSALFAAWALAAILFMVGDGRGRFGVLIYGAAGLLILPYKIWRGFRVRRQNEDSDYDFADKDMSSLNDTFS